jgi:O-antigen/teichoic acid export membrane protein
MWPAPLSMLILVATTGVRLYSIRTGKFHAVAIAQIVRAVVFVTGIIGTALCWNGLGGYGAIIMLSWQIAADACGLLVQLHANRGVARLIIMRPRTGESLRVLMRHKKTLGVLAVSEVIRSVNQQIPIATVALAFGAVPAGWYALAVAFISAPGSVVALAVSDVANQRLSRLYAAGRPVSHLVLRTTIGMAAAGLVPFATISLLAPTLLPVLMGSRWSGASHTVSILAIASYLWFVTEPATNVPLIVGARRYIILWHALRIVNWGGLGVAAACGLISYNAWLYCAVTGSSLIYISESASGFIIARAADRKRGLHGSSAPFAAVAGMEAK